MPSLQNILALVVVFLSSSLLHHISAHSTYAPLLKRVISPRTVALDIVPRKPSPFAPPETLKRRSPDPAPGTLNYDDSFRLTLSAFDDIFHLHLRPNDHLVHPAARVSYYKYDAAGRSVLDRTEPLLRESVRVYWGEVVAPHHTDARFKDDVAGIAHEPHPAEIGWARIMVHQAGDLEKGTAPIYEGAFSAHGVTYHISTKEKYMRKKQALDADVSPMESMIDEHLVIWKETDGMTLEEEHFAKTGSYPTGPVDVPVTCGHDKLEYNTNSTLNPILRRPNPVWLDVLLRPHAESGVHHRYRRQDAPTGNTGMDTNFSEFIGQSGGCPTTQKVIYMGVAADCEYVNKQGGEEAAKTQILNTWNTASALYKVTFSVSLGITELLVQSRTCPTKPDPLLEWNQACGEDLDTRLSQFSTWRGTRSTDGNGLWHLMSGCPSGPEVGIAWLATLCRTTASDINVKNSDGTTVQKTVSGTGVSTSGNTEWQVVAHEVGHNFGAIHDCKAPCTLSDSKCCPLSLTQCDAGDRFIMSPVAQAGEKVFSPCSLGNVCALMRGSVRGNPSRTDTTCLVDPDPTRATLGLQMCGNGIVEKGEDCDPGKGVTDSPCCDPTTCKFKNNAVCDPFSSPCCTEQCAFAPSTKVCRPSRDQTCDIEERCTGNNATCPVDSVAPNGRGCGANGLACASGACTSVAAQCKLFGTSNNLSQACPDKSDSSCQISCQDPDRTNGCVRLNTLLVDGSPCGYAGSCNRGKCEAGSFLDTAKAWYTSNLQIAIPVTIVAGIIVLLILWGIVSAIRRCCSGGSRKTTVIPASTPMRNRMSVPPRSQYARVGSEREPPPAAHSRGDSAGYNQGYNYNANNHANWVDPGAYNGYPSHYRP